MHSSLPLPPPQKERRRSGSPAQTTTATTALGGSRVDDALVEALKAWRREQARQQGVPPYVVFHDRTLIELAARQPGDLNALAQVSGIGSAKLERYGEAVLAVIGTATAAGGADSRPGLTP